MLFPFTLEVSGQSPSNLNPVASNLHQQFGDMIKVAFGLT